MAEEGFPLETFEEEAILGHEGVSLAFSLGCLSPGIVEGESIDIAGISVEEKGLLVALPVSAWDRKADKRKLPPGALAKPLKIAVAGCTAEDRLTAAEGKTVNLWIGWLSTALAEKVSFAADDRASICFVDRENGEACFPFAESLEMVAKEKFSIQMREGDPQASEVRLAALEEKFSSLQGSLESLLSFHRRPEESGFVTAAEEPAPKSARLAPSLSKAAAVKVPLPKPKLLAPPPPGLSAVHSYPA